MTYPRGVRRSNGLPLFLLTLALSGCVLAGDADTQVADVVIELTPGSGKGTEAEQMMRDRPDYIPGSADHLASLDTEQGTIVWIRYRQPAGGTVHTCLEQYHAEFGFTTCPGLWEDQFQGAIPTSHVTELGSLIGPDRQQVQLGVSREVAYLIATSETGTRYRLVPARNLAFIDWPNTDGTLNVEAFARGGRSLSTLTITVEGWSEPLR